MNHSGEIFPGLFCSSGVGKKQNCIVWSSCCRHTVTGLWALIPKAKQTITDFGFLDMSEAALTYNASEIKHLVPPQQNYTAHFRGGNSSHNEWKTPRGKWFKGNTLLMTRTFLWWVRLYRNSLQYNCILHEASNMLENKPNLPCWLTLLQWCSGKLSNTHKHTPVWLHGQLVPHLPHSDQGVCPCLEPPGASALPGGAQGPHPAAERAELGQHPPPQGTGHTCTWALVEDFC